MTTSTGHLSDRMPAVALGREAWSAEDLRHLAGCRQCAGEWELVRIGSRLGRDLARELDVDAVAAAVTSRLRASPDSRILRFPVRWLALIGAAAAVAALVFLGPWGPRPTQPGIGAQQVLLPELEALSEDELEAVFEVLPPDGSTPAPAMPNVGDLTDDEFRSLLRTLEG